MIQQGDVFPSVTLKTMGSEGPEAVAVAELFADKKVVLFAVPGAFTPTCSAAHLPGFVVNVDAIKAKGVDIVACTSVNDVFVMDAWSKNQNAEHILMLADGNGELAKALGLELDGTGFGMGLRSKRYAMIIDHGKVSFVAVDEKGFELSSAEAILAALD
jgi:peroxiredoxin